MQRLRVSLNGTDTNPWHRLGFKQNPFPQIAKAEYDGAERRLQSLGGDPIPHDTPDAAEVYIRQRLNGFTPEFIQLCVDQFKPGEYVRFTVTFPEQP